MFYPIWSRYQGWIDMANLAALFATAQHEVVQLTSEPDNQVKLMLYSLFKQATSGNVTGSRPGLFNAVNRAKYDARVRVQGMSAEEAMQRYVDLVAQLKVGT